ncbi:SPOC domain-like protein [Roridomyces roridus]|uniref:ATP-dependent DNA helicase II subunit 2 n=1 Tax=Roridomyces roridus TaxID=1738132 RepID=A0AAD7BTC9_9AGAR|nr:SPOC domain-like protein [Roridomyces roridus]
MSSERAGYTVTMFVVDVGPSMAKIRTHDPEGSELTHELTNLQWGLQFVKLKVQEMIFNGRKTDQCGVILFGSDKTRNIVSKKQGGYERVEEYIPIAQPNAGTLAKLDALEPTEEAGDALDALIVAMETQEAYLGKKKWTRNVVVVTDGENPIEVKDLKGIVRRLKDLQIRLTVVGIDFDDDTLPFEEEDKSDIKAENERWYTEVVNRLNPKPTVDDEDSDTEQKNKEEGTYAPTAFIGTCELALREISRPEVKVTKSTLKGTTLRLGDNDSRPEEAMQINIKTSKCTARSMPKSWKKFGPRDQGKGKKKGKTDKKKPKQPVEGSETEDSEDEKMDVDDESAVEEDENGVPKKVTYVQLKMDTEYYVDPRDHNSDDEDGDVKMEEPEEDEGLSNKVDPALEQVAKDDLVKGFKYGTTYVPCPDGQFDRLPAKEGIDICGFFPKKNFRRELSMGEVQYIWGDPKDPMQEVAVSSIAQAMYEKGVMAIARWVTTENKDPKMGVLSPYIGTDVDCLLWVGMPFADDVRKYTFASLDNLVSKKGEEITEHPYIPTEKQLEAMDNFVDNMDLMDAGDKDEEGNRGPWFETPLSYNPAIHRIKQAQFHAAVTSDLATNPLPPPHPELLKYWDPPRPALKRSRDAVEKCQLEFKVKEVPKKVAKTRKDGHVHAKDDDDDILLLDAKPRASQATKAEPVSSPDKGKSKAAEDSETEDESEDEAAAKTKPKSTPPPKNGPSNPLPTPARSLSPQIDPGRAPGRIIGSTRPLADFKTNVACGEAVSKAVEDMGAVITEIVLKPFASRRNAELLECLEVLRETCLKKDEIDAWNTFIEELCEKCTSEPGNRQFWDEVRKVGRKLSLISDQEAEENGGTSTVSHAKADEFLA